jgi:hypothetical protein
VIFSILQEPNRLLEFEPWEVVHALIDLGFEEVSVPWLIK